MRRFCGEGHPFANVRVIKSRGGIVSFRRRRASKRRPYEARRFRDDHHTRSLRIRAFEAGRDDLRIGPLVSTILASSGAKVNLNSAGVTNAVSQIVDGVVAL